MTTINMPHMTKDQIHNMMQAAEQWIDEIEQDEINRQTLFGHERILVKDHPIQLRGNITLKPFQIDGVQWLLDKHQFRASGAILADEMGLGKTLQVIAYIAAVFQHFESNTIRNQCPHYNRPCFLIIAPLTVLDNWQQHMDDYCPDTISFITYRGNNAMDRDNCQDQILEFRKLKISAFQAEYIAKYQSTNRMGDNDDDNNDGMNTNKKSNKNNSSKQQPTAVKSHPCVDVVITSYETLLNDKDFFCQFHWNGIILDESHRIKNNCTTTFTLFKRIPQPYFYPPIHTTLYPNADFDFVTSTSGFLNSMLPSLTQRVIDGNGNPNYAEQSIHANTKTNMSSVQKSVLQQTGYACKQHILSYDSCILLTGTLVQNNIPELWTLLHLSLPKCFPLNSQVPFNRIFQLISTHNFTLPGEPPPLVQRVLTLLHRCLDFIMLRRTKTSANINLPPKTTYVLFSGLTSLQKRLYRSVLGKNSKDLLNCLSATADSGDSDDDPPDSGRGSLLLKQHQNNDSDDDTTTTADGKKKKAPRYQPGRKSTSTSEKRTVTKVSQNQLLKSLKSMKSIWISLRKIINHAYLIPNVEPQPYVEGEHSVSASGKLVLLDAILKRILPQGHRVLIFSTSTETLDILQDYCSLRNYNQVRLDGSVRGSGRGDLISTFQNQKTTPTSSSLAPAPTQKRNFSQLGKLDAKQLAATSTTSSTTNGSNDIPIFLLSTRAAGVGITLTSADTVIFYDSDFNQAVDLQAEQRCYRIGQTKPVLSLRLVCRGSIEHLYYLRSVRKAALADAVMREGRFKPFLTQKEKLESDRSYVNIVVPDSVMDGDPESKIAIDSEPQFVEATDKHGKVFLKSAPQQKPEPVDQNELNVAYQCLLTRGVNEDDINTTTKQLNEHDKEKIASLLYTDDDLDWITTDGYSPTYGKDNNDDDIEINENIQRRRKIGGLTDFMMAANLDHARESKQTTIIKTMANGSLQTIDRSDNNMTTLHMGDNDDNSNTNENGVEITTGRKTKIFDPTNIPTMQLAHFQDIVTVDFERDEKAEEAEYKRIRELRKSNQTNTTTTTTTTTTQSTLNNNTNERARALTSLEAPSKSSLEEFLLDLEATEGLLNIQESNIVEGKRQRKSTDTDLRSFLGTSTSSGSSFDSNKDKKSTSKNTNKNQIIDDDDLFDSPSTTTTQSKRKSMEKQSKPKSARSTDPIERVHQSIEELLPYFIDMMDSLDEALIEHKTRAKAWLDKGKKSAIIPPLDDIASILIAFIRPSIIPLILQEISTTTSNNYTIDDWHAYLARYFDPTMLVPPEYLLPDVQHLIESKSKSLQHWNLLYNQFFEYYSTLYYVRESCFSQYNIAQHMLSYNTILDRLVKKVVPTFLTDLTGIAMTRIQPYLDDQTTYLPQYQTNDPQEQITMQKDILFTTLFILIDNILNEFRLLVCGLDSVNPSYYHTIPLQQFIEEGIDFPLPYIGTDCKSSDATPLYQSSTQLIISNKDDFTRWLFNSLMIYSPHFVDDILGHNDGELVKPLKKQRFQIDFSNVIQLEHMLQFALVYTSNQLVPPLKHTHKRSHLVQDDDNNNDNDNQQQDQQLDEIYDFDSDELINNVAQLHHVKGNMFLPCHSVGSPRAACYPEIAEADRNWPMLDETQLFPMSRANGYIILNFADNSGKFGSGRVFSTLQHMSPQLKQNYANAKEMRRCRLGAAILGEITNDPPSPPSKDQNNQDPVEVIAETIQAIEQSLSIPKRLCYVANLIVIDSEHRDQPPSMEKIAQALEKVLCFAKLLGLVVITPKQGYSHGDMNHDYYAYERLLTSKVGLLNVDCYIFHYSHVVRKTERHMSSNGNLLRQSSFSRSME